MAAENHHNLIDYKTRSGKKMLCKSSGKEGYFNIFLATAMPLIRFLSIRASLPT